MGRLRGLFSCFGALDGRPFSGSSGPDVNVGCRPDSLAGGATKATTAQQQEAKTPAVWPPTETPSPSSTTPGCCSPAWTLHTDCSPAGRGCAAVGQALGQNVVSRFSLQHPSSPGPSSLGQNCSLQLVANEVELLQDLRLGRVVAKGESTCVLRGTWEGAKVAVKLVTLPCLTPEVLASCSTLLNQSLSHPYLLQYFFARALRLTQAHVDVALAAIPLPPQRKPHQQERVDSAACLELYSQVDAQARPASAFMDSAAGCDGAEVDWDSDGDDDDCEYMHDGAAVGEADMCDVLLARESLVLVGASSSEGGCSGLLQTGSRSRMPDLASALRSLPHLTPGHYVLLLVSEHCCMGNLGSMLASGSLAATASAASPPGSHLPAHLQTRAVLRTAREVALALAHLHALGHTHGRVTLSNVMLSESHQDRRGFCAKVGDSTLAHARAQAAARGATLQTLAPALLTHYGELAHAQVAAPSQTQQTAAAAGPPAAPARPQLMRFATANVLELGTAAWDAMAQDVLDYGLLLQQLVLAACEHGGAGDLGGAPSALDDSADGNQGHRRGRLCVGLPRELFTLVDVCTAPAAYQRPSFVQIVGCLSSIEDTLRAREAGGSRQLAAVAGAAAAGFEVSLAGQR